MPKTQQQIQGAKSREKHRESSPKNTLKPASLRRPKVHYNFMANEKT